MMESLLYVTEIVFYLNYIFMGIEDIKERKVYRFQVVAFIILSFVLILTSGVNMLTVRKLVLIGISGLILPSLVLKNFIDISDSFVVMCSTLLINEIILFYIMVMFLVSVVGLMMFCIKPNKKLRMPLIPFLLLCFMFIRGVENDMRRLEGDEKGSSSIEAAIILSAFILILCGVIYVSFYLHDVIVIKAVSAKKCESIEKGSGEADFLKEVSDELAGKLYVIKKIKVNGKVGSSVKISVTGEYEGYANGLFKAIGKGKYEYSYKCKRSVSKNDLYGVRVIKNIVGSIEKK